jgi:hypothetical protein
MFRLPRDRPHALTPTHRLTLEQNKLFAKDRAALGDLWDSFRDIYQERIRPAGDNDTRMLRAFRVCGQMMLALDCTYWAVTWDRVLAWRGAVLAAIPHHSPQRHRAWNQSWTEVMAALFFLDVLPYREEIYKLYHRDLAWRQLGPDRAGAIADRFIEVALQIGYRHEHQIRQDGARTLLAVMVAAGKADFSDLTRADFEAWEQHGARSPRIPTAGVMMSLRVLAAMGVLQPEATGLFGGHVGERVTWGRTAPSIAATFQRFLADWKTTRRPTTLQTYTRSLQRFGDWLAE